MRLYLPLTDHLLPADLPERLMRPRPGVHGKDCRTTPGHFRPNGAIFGATRKRHNHGNYRRKAQGGTELCRRNMRLSEKVKGLLPRGARN